MADSEAVVEEVNVKSQITKPPKKKVFNYDNFFSGFFLIIIGMIFLLNTFGILPWSVWSGFIILMLKFWPVILIYIGFRIVFGTNRILKIISDIFWIIFLVFVFVVSVVSYSGNFPLKERLVNKLPFLITLTQNIDFNSNLQTSEVKVVKEEGDKYNNMDLNLNLLAGKLDLVDENIPEYLILKSKYSNNVEEPTITQTKDLTTLSLDFSPKYNPNILNFNTRSEFNMQVGEILPLRNLVLNLTAGETNIDLSKVGVRTTEVKMTAGNSTLKFTEESLPETINIKLVAGDLILKLPKDIGVEINNKSLAGEVLFNNRIIDDNGRSLFNEDKAKKVKIEIDQTAGNIVIISNN